MAPKRAPGGGRKPKGPVAARSVTVRMPEDVYSELEAAVRQHRNPRRTITDELVARLRHSFGVERQERRDPGLQALVYLIAELAERAHFGIDPERWHRDPWTFGAFKVGVSKLLDVLEPGAGLRDPREMTEQQKGFSERASSLLSEPNATVSAEKQGAQIAASTINDLLRRGVPDKWNWTSHLRKQKAEHPAEPKSGDLLDRLEGDARDMTRARLALGIGEPKSAKKGGRK